MKGSRGTHLFRASSCRLKMNPIQLQSTLLLAAIIAVAICQQDETPAETVPGSAILLFEPPRSRSAILSTKRVQFFNRDVKNILASPQASSTPFSLGSLQGLVVTNASLLELNELRQTVEDLQGIFSPDYVYKIRLPFSAAATTASVKNSNKSACNSNAPCNRRQLQSLYSQQLDLLDLHANDGYYCSPAKSDVKTNVFVMDTGIDKSHADFAGIEINTYDAAPKSGRSQWTPFEDKDSHGTHVAGIIGSATYGITQNVVIHAVKVLNDVGAGSTSTILSGLNILRDWLKSNPSKRATVNLSLSGNRDSSLERVITAVANEFRAQLVIIVAAGNEAALACKSNLPSVNELITVGSVSSKLVESDFSNYGTCVDVFAVGEKIMSTIPNSKFGVKSGTSMAAPVVTGVISQYWVENPEKTGLEIRNMILIPVESDLDATGLLSLSDGSPDKLIRYACDGECSSCSAPSTAMTVTTTTARSATQTTSPKTTLKTTSTTTRTTSSTTTRTTPTTTTRTTTPRTTRTTTTRTTTPRTARTTTTRTTTQGRPTFNRG